MFILHTSNKTENLLIHLAKVLEMQPLRSPFEKELFLIQSQGMERWLSQQLARRFRVFGNYDFLFPGAFFTLLAEKIDRDLRDDAFDRDRLLWRLEGLLRRQSSEAPTPLARYLSGETAALKRFQLSQQLAQLFDQYQMMRPHMLTAWQEGRRVIGHSSEGWQQALWLDLTEQLGDRHRGALWLEAIERLDAGPEGDLAAVLPERISIFGVNSMPPLFLDFLRGLARHIQVHLYLLNPCETYWADLETKKQTARRNLKKLEKEREPEAVFPINHPLLAALGQQGREFQEMLLEQVAFELELESFESAALAASNLRQLQNDILGNRQEPAALQNDGSIQIHACHSRVREVEVLKDRLLHILESDPDVEVRDIVVMAPDIQVYAPFVTAVFDGIPHAIADRSVRLSNELLDVFIRFLQLSRSRFGWQAVLDLLEQPSVYPEFGLSDTDLELIRYWVRETSIRWGRSAQHKEQMDLPAIEANTWQAGLERLFMGYAMGDGPDFVDDILPFAEVEGVSAQALGGLAEYMRLLFDAASDLNRPKPLTEWASRLDRYADRLFPSQASDEQERTELNELLLELGRTFAPIHSGEIELEVIVAWLESACSERISSSGFLRGRLTFCSMLPMRSIPFKVIALLGLNEGEFPKVERPATFDLLSHTFRKGDRSHRADDRYQFLEILLSARDRLIMTYIGRSIRDNEPIPPSVVVSELLEVLDAHYQLSGLVVEHPLQPFSRRYFTGDSDLFSYSHSHCETAQAMIYPEREQVSWWSGTVEREPVETIDLLDLFVFFRHPQKYFVQHQLSLRLKGIEDEPQEREPFGVGGLDAYQIEQGWIEELLSGREVTVDRLNAQGLWPCGAPGRLLFERTDEELSKFVESIRSKNMGARLVNESIDLAIGGCRLVGKLSNLYEQGSLIYRYTNLKGKDLLHAWLHHLIINRVRPGNTCLLSKDHDLLLTPEQIEDDALEQWVGIYGEGQNEPSSFFVEPALAYVKQAASQKARKSPIDAACSALRKEFENGYIPELNLLYRDVEDLDSLLDETFEERCRTLLLPVWEAAREQ
jgi:exodeoxyribonuclease V gamma subunit